MGCRQVLLMWLRFVRGMLSCTIDVASVPGLLFGEVVPGWDSPCSGEGDTTRFRLSARVGRSGQPHGGLMGPHGGMRWRWTWRAWWAFVLEASAALGRDTHERLLRLRYCGFLCVTLRLGGCGEVLTSALGGCLRSHGRASGFGYCHRLDAELSHGVNTLRQCQMEVE